ncbi:uncharacterized protein LOC114526345 [Dendronephthya gigantea]|uniref:uncharacterized protein LOC114526345 n=1 Tax=Dendronephthya gigantea TaxID=151771 RepID=UPI00106D364A|nr:uncharacterized protein LOC114526345 [Dendronephthya gigantea]
MLNLNADKDQCSSCITGINCCLTSEPCLNNGVCIPSFTNNTRFTCKCIDGYTGHRCNTKLAPTPPQKPKSCHAFLNVNQGAGLYKIFDNDDKEYTVRCSFDSNMAWTVVQSYEYSQRGGFRKPIYEDDAKNEDIPSWKYYRLSKPRMESIHQDSNPKWRLTCNFNTDGFVATDYVIATHADVPLLPSNSVHDGCKIVESVNIRGKSCSNCKVVVRHKQSWGIHLDSYDSYRVCFNEFPGSRICGEDNFGYYLCRNTEHRCSSTEGSTTQLWFGGA